VLDSFGDTTVFRVAQGLYWAMDQGATVINVSLGTLADPALLRDAMNEAEARGVVIVAAAGNDSTSSPPRSPASLRSLGALSVASTDALGVRSDFSNYGTWIAISAPGQGAIGPVPGGGYGSADGTSFASPLVAGVVALLRAECPLLSPQALRDQIAQTAQSINAQNPSYLGQLGAGWVRADAALGVGQGPLDCRCDRDNNGRVNVEDLYLQIAQPGDLNGDGVADELDAIDLEALLRRHELRR
jgi:subtilisin family serine protease